MNIPIIVLGAIFAFTMNAQAIGTQHGVFRSQSTQGDYWRGSAKIIKEQYNITVYPDYLDVELDWEFEVGMGYSSSGPDSFKNALEIVGNLNLEDRATVVGMITWYKGDILKGKLKTRKSAREQYEQVVERNSDAPPPPRDPVLLEWIRDDNYDISIFPVEFGGTRKVRIRYLIPAFTKDGDNKIGYPHAFTNGAKVQIKKATGLKGYRIESGSSSASYENSEYVFLNNSKHAFRYGSNRISHIVPLLENEPLGSIMYTGRFSTPTFSGQMAHVTTMDGETALQMAQIPTDYVILWRWNHPQWLERYARQIVEQSYLLQEFLISLDKANMRAALIIDKEGGERIIFMLDKKGSAEYNRMIVYLSKLSNRHIVEPPESAGSDQSTYDISKAVREFNYALKAAQSLFNSKSKTMKHLLILTAGPKAISKYISTEFEQIDQSINVALLTSFAHQKLTINIGYDYAAEYAYWPGVNLDQFVKNHTTGLKVYASISNSEQSIKIEVLSDQPNASRYCPNSGSKQMHIYSDKFLKSHIRWSIYQGNSMITEFIERPRIIVMKQAIQYARMIGSSQNLVPLAKHMPSSMASTLGFIDDKYALVALEEDALPTEEAVLYANAGVPTLKFGDIFPSDEERADVPVSQWLTLNPPVSLNGHRCVDFQIENKLKLDATEVTLLNTTGVLISPFEINIVANDQNVLFDGLTMTFATQDQTFDIFAAPMALEIKPQTSNFDDINFFIKNGFMIIDLSKLSLADREKLRLVLYDISGKVIMQWSRSELISKDSITFSISNHKLSRGVYLLGVNGANVSFSHRVIVW